MEEAHEAKEHSVSEEIEIEWEKLLESQNWEALLDPFDLNLRKFIIRCGDLCQAAYDSFEGKGSNNANNPNFHHVQLDNNCTWHDNLHATPSLTLSERFIQYAMREKVIRYLATRSRHVATHTEHVATWMGYSAYGSLGSRRVIYISWRGTKRLFEWRNNLMVTRASAECLLSGGDSVHRRKERTPRVAKGWLSIYTSVSDRVEMSARNHVNTSVNKLLEMFEGEKISIVVTGHSLGGILAILTAFDIAENLVGEDVRVVAVVFGCPRVGNREFRERVKMRRNLNVLQVRNKIDVVTYLPPARRVGTELVVDSRKSNVLELRESKNMGLLHDLETYLHTVAGWNGKENEFEMKVDRSNERLMKSTKAFDYNRGEIEKFFSRIKSKCSKLFKQNRPSSESENSDEE